MSRAQESAAKVFMGNPISANNMVESIATPSVADTVFIQRTRSRVKHWKNAFTDSSTMTHGKKIKDSTYFFLFSTSLWVYMSVSDALVRSLRKLVLGSEECHSRPCMNIDVCSERQVQLVIEVRLI